MNKNLIILLAFASFLFTGCKKSTSEAFSYTAWGDYGAITVVTSEASWNDLDTVFRQTISPPLKGIASYEPVFTIRKADEKTFDGFLLNNYVIVFCVHGGNYNKLKNSVPVKVQRKIEEALKAKDASTFVLKDVWATPQRVQFIVGPTRDQLVDYLKAKKDGLVRQIHKMEQETIIVKVLGDPKAKNSFADAMSKRVGYCIKKPETFRHSLQKESFNGISQSLAEKHLGIYAHHEDYSSQGQFDLDYIIQRRNSVMGKYIEGADRKDSLRTYMSTNTKDVLPFYKVTEINGHYAVETRGWWTMENDYSAGPFVNYTIHCPSINKIVTLEGVVFAPGEDKMPLLRELELILNTFQVKNEHAEEKK
jgi:hypothetical protein